MNKYRAKPTVLDGIRFASRRECTRYVELKLLQRAGKITELALQPVYRLHVRGIKIGSYRADFKYLDVETGKYRVEDSKGFPTQLYRWKKRHVEAEWNITIEEV